MATLHTVAEDTKKIIRFAAIFAVSIILFIFLLRFGTYLKNRLFPTPPKPPTVTFGKLPQIPFPSSKNQTVTYQLNTVTGTLPVFSDRATIFKIIQPQPNLLNLERIQRAVGLIDFTQPGIPLSKTLYEWDDGEPLFRRLTLDILTQEYKMTSNFLTNTNIASGSAPNPPQAIGTAGEFLFFLSPSIDDLDAQKTKTKLLLTTDSKITQASSLSNASVIEIDFFQKDVEGLPVFYPNPPSSPMVFIVTEIKQQKKVVSATFSHHALSEVSATYPLKTADEAFSELKAGNAYIPPQISTSSASIRNVLLGYYISDGPQEYLMPIVIFEGDNNFFAYVSAIKNNWIK